MEEIVTASKDKTQLVMFYGTFCPPCRMLKPVLEKFQGDDYDVHFVDVEANISLAVREGIMSVPTVFIYSEGNKVGGWKGYIRENKITEVLNKLITSE